MSEIGTDAYDGLALGREGRNSKMENELLRLENAFLRGTSYVRNDTSPRVGSSGHAERQPGGENVLVDQREYEKLCRAKYDLRWLLKRLESTPARGVLRRFRGWQTLVERHLSE